MKSVGKVLKIVVIGISCVVQAIAIIYAFVGAGVTMNERAKDHENYASKVSDMAVTGYKNLWKEVSKR